MLTAYCECSITALDGPAMGTTRRRRWAFVVGHVGLLMATRIKCCIHPDLPPSGELGANDDERKSTGLGPRGLEYEDETDAVAIVQEMPDHRSIVRPDPRRWVTR
jgi:hypothetical protein